MRQAGVAALVALLCLAHGSHSGKILGLFHFQGRSHWVMAEALMLELAARGHDVTVVSHFPQKNPPPNYRDLSIAGAAPVVTNNFTVDFVRNLTLASVLEYLWDATRSYCYQNYEHPVIKKLIQEKGKYDLIVTEVFGTDCFAAFSHHLGGVPMVAMTSSVMLPWGNTRMANPDNPAYIPNYFMPYSSHMSFWERLVNTVTTLYDNIGFEYFCAKPLDELNRHYFGEDIPPTSHLVRNTSLLLINSHFSINIPRPFVPGVVEVGGLHIPTTVKELPPELKRFIDGAPSDLGVVLFTFGSVVRADTLPEDKATAFIEAFRQLAPQRVVWKIDGTALKAKGFSLPKNVLTADWVPQFDILSHPKTRAFISHGGLMGSQEAVHTAVPMLGIPLFADQKLNVPNLERLGTAIHLDFDDVTSQTLVDALRKLTEPGSKYRQRALELSRLFRDRPRTPRDEAVYWTEYVLRHGGAPHLRSAALDLAWYQYLLLDVTVFLLGVAALVAAALYYCLRFIVSFCTRSGHSQSTMQKKKN